MFLFSLLKQTKMTISGEEMITVNSWTVVHFTNDFSVMRS